MRAPLVAGRLLVAALLVWTGWIHLHLWTGGYRHIHVVGPLFLANAVTAAVTAAVVLAAPRRLVGPAAFGAALLAGGTLAGLAVSVNVGLFGFHDSLRAPFATLSIWVEVALGLVALALAGATLRGSRRPGVTAGRPSAGAAAAPPPG